MFLDYTTAADAARDDADDLRAEFRVLRRRLCLECGDQYTYAGPHDCMGGAYEITEEMDDDTE